jgi:ribosomal protein S18 acetylase RimI-like enzyme
MKLESQLPRVPFLTFDWFVTWWEHWHVQRPMIRDNLFVITFSSARGVLVGVAPLILTCRPGFGLAATRELMSFGIDPSLTELRPVVVPDCYRTQVYGALFEYLNDHPRSWDWLTLTSVPKGVGIERLLASYSGRVKWLKEVPNYVIELPKTFEELKAPLPRNIKESIRKCYNSLRRAGLDFELRVLECVEELQGGLETFYALHRARAGLADSVIHRDAFANERARGFLQDICKRFVRRGRLRIFQLIINGQAVATRIAFVQEDTLYTYFSGFDPQYRKYSVATTLLAEILRYAIRNGLAFVNLSTGRDESKLRWRPKEVMYGDLSLISPMKRSVIAHEITVFGKEKLHDMVVKHRVLDFLARRRD